MSWPAGLAITFGTSNTLPGFGALTSTLSAWSGSTVPNTLLLWNIRLSDGSVFQVEGVSALEARSAAEGAERAARLIGRDPRVVVEVVSA